MAHPAQGRPDLFWDLRCGSVPSPPLRPQNECDSTGLNGIYRKDVTPTSEFPNLQNAKQYVEAAWDFVTNPPAGVLTKARANGDVLLYDAATNTFAVKNAQGVPRTMFKPKDGAAYFHTQK